MHPWTRNWALTSSNDGLLSPPKAAADRGSYSDLLDDAYPQRRATVIPPKGVNAVSLIRHTGQWKGLGSRSHMLAMHSHDTRVRVRTCDVMSSASTVSYRRASYYAHVSEQRATKRTTRITLDSAAPPNKYCSKCTGTMAAAKIRYHARTTPVCNNSGFVRFSRSGGK